MYQISFWTQIPKNLKVCLYSNSRNDIPRVAQWYGTIAAHTRRRASILVVFVVFCLHIHSFAGLIRRTPPPTFSDTAITDRHSDTTIFQLRAHWVRLSWSIGSEKSFGHVPPVQKNLNPPKLPYIRYCFSQLYGVGVIQSMKENKESHRQGVEESASSYSLHKLCMKPL